MNHPTAEDLGRIDLLSDLSAAARAELAPRFEVEEFDTGRVVFREGQAGYAFYVIESGRLAVTHGDETVRELGPGDFFGEIAILGEGRRTATVTVTESAVLWMLFGTEFRVLQSERPEVAEALRSAMRERIEAD